MKEKAFNKTWQEVAKDWNDGKNVWSGEMGGIGPGYEQCIQTLIFEILTDWDESQPVVVKDGAEYSPQFKEYADEISYKCSARLGGMTGAQVGAAQSLAGQFIYFGYQNMMEKLPDDRLIQVDKNWPTATEAAK